MTEVEHKVDSCAQLIIPLKQTSTNLLYEDPRLTRSTKTYLPKYYFYKKKLKICSWCLPNAICLPYAPPSLFQNSYLYHHNYSYYGKYTYFSEEYEKKMKMHYTYISEECEKNMKM